MANATSFFTRTRSKSGRWDWTDYASYGYLLLGVLVVFGPVIWLLLSSFKTEAEIQRFPPRFLPYVQQTVMVDGYDEPLAVYDIVSGEFEGRRLAQIRRVGLISQMVDPDEPGERLKVDLQLDDRRVHISRSFQILYR